MWRERYGAVCRRHPDLVAVFESGSGRLALLLRHTPVPLPEEEAVWLAETRRAARAVIGSLRCAGLRAPVLVLQWRSFDEVSNVLRAWPCRFEADHVRRGEIACVVARALDDRRFVNARRVAARGALRPAGLARPRPAWRRSLSGWYHDMVPTWLAAEPPIRRQLIVQTHRWIVERVLRPLSVDAGPRVEDLRPGGAFAPGGPLARTLARSLRPSDVDAWRHWIRLVLADLERALARPGHPSAFEWLRWLFLIPYSIPVRPGSPRAARADSGRVAAEDASESMGVQWEGDGLAAVGDR